MRFERDRGLKNVFAYSCICVKNPAQSMVAKRGKAGYRKTANGAAHFLCSAPNQRSSYEQQAGRHYH